MKTGRMYGAAGLLCCVLACALGVACSAAKPDAEQMLQTPQIPAFTKAMGIGEGVLAIEYDREGDAVRFVVRDAHEQLDTFTFRILDGDRLAPATQGRRMTFWVLGENLQEVEEFVRRGSCAAPTPLTVQSAADLGGHYHNLGVIEFDGRIVIVLWSEQGKQVYANVESGAGVSGFAAADFGGIRIRLTATERKVLCCVDCGGSGVCCCDGGTKCVAKDREVQCRKGDKVVEWCWCDGSNCGCRTVDSHEGEHNDSDDESTEVPGMGNQEE